MNLHVRRLLVVPALIVLLGAVPAPKSMPAATIEEAIPADATMALYLRRIDPGLGRSLELLAQLFGVDAAVEFLHEAPLPMLALRTVENGQQVGIDAGKGLGLFRTPAFDGLVGVVGVADAKKATRAVTELLEKRGGKRIGVKNGLVHVELPDGFAFAIGTARGYLYLFMESGDLPLLPSASQGSRDPQRLAAELRGARGPGLGANARVALLRGRATGADLFLYVHQPFSSDSDLRDAFFAADLRNGEVRLDGFAAVEGATWPAARPATRDAGLDAGAPFGHALIGAPLDRLVSLVAGNPGTSRRVLLGRALAAEGLELEAMLSALPAELTVRAWASPAEPLPRLTVAAEAAMAPGKAAEKALTKLLTETRPFQRIVAQGGETLYVTSVLGQPVTASASKGRLRAIAGHLPEQKSGSATGGEPLVPGHVKLMLDLRALGMPLGRPVNPAEWLGPDAGESAEEAPLPFGRGELDVFPEEGGLRIRGLLLPDDGLGEQVQERAE